MRLFQESSEPSSPHAPKDNADTRPRRGPTRPDEPSASPREGLEDSRRYLQVIRLTATVVALALPLYCYPTASSPGSEAAPRGRRLGRVRPLRRRPTSSTRPTRRWRRPCAARARDPRRSVLARRRDRRTPGSVPALIGQSAARHHGRVAGEPDQASGACFGAGSTRGTGSHETGGGVGGSQPSGDGRPIVTVMRAGSWRSLTQQRPPDGPAQSPDLERLRQHACLDDRPPLTPAPPLTTTLGRDTRPVRGGLDDELQCRSRASRPGRVRPVRQRPTSEARSVELGHLQVRHDQVVPPPSKQPPGLGPIAGRVHVMTGRPEARYHQIPRALIVVDDEDAPAGDTWFDRRLIAPHHGPAGAASKVPGPWVSGDANLGRPALTCVLWVTVGAVRITRGPGDPARARAGSRPHRRPARPHGPARRAYSLFRTVSSA